MLVELAVKDSSGMDDILSFIGGGKKPSPKSVFHKGYYQINHFNFNFYLGDALIEEYPDLDDFSCYGVCDTIAQFHKKIGEKLNAISDRNFVVSFTEIKKSEQPKGDGWRWHKWGEYIGDHHPQCEYLVDEPLIGDVYVFHVYEISNP